MFINGHPSRPLFRSCHVVHLEQASAPWGSGVPCRWSLALGSPEGNLKRSWCENGRSRCCWHGKGLRVTLILNLGGDVAAQLCGLQPVVVVEALQSPFTSRGPLPVQRLGSGAAWWALWGSVHLRKACWAKAQKGESFLFLLLSDIGTFSMFRSWSFKIWSTA